MANNEEGESKVAKLEDRQKKKRRSRSWSSREAMERRSCARTYVAPQGMVTTITDLMRGGGSDRQIDLGRYIGREDRLLLLLKTTEAIELTIVKRMVIPVVVKRDKVVVG